ncbi:MAG: GHKL domain-containing protein [Ignavibacteriales bacterium]|nr:GHKL domain-containing protein [Ignavibacteriales bacterium]
MAQGKKIQLSSAVSTKFEVYADSKMLISILENLISNAIKFTPENGIILISAKQVKNRIRISIKDSGTGIAKEDLTKLFTLGEHFSSPGTNNEKGTGLGLLLVKEMIEQHGGVISIESEIGKGSTFSFTIPSNW